MAVWYLNNRTLSVDDSSEIIDQFWVIYCFGGRGGGKYAYLDESRNV